jgi:hypothetical protein
MTEDALTAVLAEQIMGWRAAPDRFLKSGRVWIPRWRFQPFRKIEDAFTLLDAASPLESVVSSDGTIKIFVRVRIGPRTGEAVGEHRAAVISSAVARAVGLEVDDNA